VEQWLRSIELAHHYTAFCDQGITIDQVGDLTDDDLRELGLSIGDRKRFRRGVAALPSSSAAPLGAPLVIERTRAERRPLTIMFVDLVNSSELGERLEAEDLLETIRRYREFAGVAIRRVGGMIGRLIGDGILAYFCYPVATENDPERAVRAALEIARGIGALETPAGVRLNVRIGIATGQVIVSDLFAGGTHDMGTIFGSTPNLASRLQGFASSGGIVIAEETYARVGKLFVCEDLGKREVRGFAQPNNAWRVIGETPATSASLVSPRLTPFFDRQAEVAILAERWHCARAGEGCTVLVVGDAGIGKSRLIEHFLAPHIGNTAHTMRLAGSALHEDSTLYPVIAFLRLTARLEPDDPRDVQLEKLKSVIAGDDATKHEVLPILAELVGIRSDGLAARRAMSPEQLREQILSVLAEQLLSPARDKPLCLLFEDLHWLDPTSRELLGRLVASIAGRSGMILLTARSGFEAPWIARHATTVVHLVPLSPADVADMVQSLFTDRDVPGGLGNLIARRTDGVPLFVEEVARSLLQLNTLDDLGNDDTGLPDQAIPASLRESLMARLDRSGVAKEIAQISAVIGRSAKRDVVAAVAALSGNALDQPLAALRDAGVLILEFVDGAEGYTFSHALLRDAAYDSLLRDDRRQLHLRVARALEALDPQTVAHQPELLAMHLTEGSEPEEAAPHWLEAARRSLARNALTEATRLLKRGLDALGKLPATDDVKRLRLQLSGLLGPALIGLRGPGSPEAQALYGDAYALCSEMPEEPSLFPIYWGWWRVSQGFQTWLQRSDVILRRAVKHDHPEFLLQAHHSQWASHYHVGDFTRCREHIEAGLAIYERGDYRHHAALYGNHDPKVCAFGEWAQLLWMQGRPHSAFTSERTALEWAEALDHHGSRVHASDTSLLHRVYRRDYAEVFRRAGELVSFTSAHAMSDHRSKGLIFRGWITAIQEDPVTGLRTLQEGLAHQRSSAAREDFPVYLCLLAEAQMARGRPDLAAGELTQAIKEFDRLGLHSWRPEVLRMLGEATLAEDPKAFDEADTLFREAARIADQQGAAMLQLRTAVSTARLYLQLDRVPNGLQQLTSAITAIVEDDDGPDLREARSMVAQLHARLGADATPLTRRDPR
jgi:class 3 adenylate cyclase/predicted ATPase